MVDIVYILGPGSKWEDNEIRYSIRSVLKHVKNYGKIWIVGHKPRVDLDAPTTFIPLAPKPTHKNGNIRAALKEIALTQDCSEKFVYMNDDFFFMQDADAETIPNYFCGTLGSRSSFYTKATEGYWRTICYTWGVLSALGYPTRDYEIHGPILMEKKKLLSALVLPGTESLLQIRSIYANLHGGTIKHMTDSKLGLNPDPEFTREKFLKIINNRPFFSIGDELSKDIKSIFEEIYPNTNQVFAPVTHQPAIDKANEEFVYMI